MKHTMSLMRHVRHGLLTLASVFLLSTNAYAGGSDFDLARLCSASGCGEDTSVQNFKDLARTYGALFAPMHLNPASTVGQAGFEIAVSSKMSFATDKAAFWGAINSNENKTADADGKYDAPDVFATLDLSMRKGLPFSLELEGDVNWLANSSMFYVGAGLRWAITEGWWFLPDISVRGHVGTIVGESDISMVNVNVDAAISYTWGLGGIASITPYAGYSALINISSSHPIIIYVPSTDSSGKKTVEAVEQVFNRSTQFVNRGFVGLQLKGEAFVFDVAGEFGKDVKSVGLKIGALF